MKKGFFIFSIVLIATVFLNSSVVKAEDMPTSPTPWGNNGSSNTENYSNANKAFKPTEGSHSSPSTNLPINNGVVFLLIAGVTIGVTTIKKYNALKPI
jgi:hypothetical protein